MGQKALSAVGVKYWDSERMYQLSGRLLFKEGSCELLVITLAFLQRSGDFREMDSIFTSVW